MTSTCDAPPTRFTASLCIFSVRPGWDQRYTEKMHCIPCGCKEDVTETCSVVLLASHQRFTCTAGMKWWGAKRTMHPRSRHLRSLPDGSANAKKMQPITLRPPALCYPTVLSVTVGRCMPYGAKNRRVVGDALGLLSETVEGKE